MNNQVMAGSIEDKWVDFVFAEFDTRGRDAALFASGRRRAVHTFRLVEVRASYLWLFAGALVALWMR